MNMINPAVRGKTSESAVVNSRALLTALKRVGMTIQKRNIVPILGCARVRAMGSALVVSGTDMDNEISVAVEATVSPGFAAMLPGVSEICRVVTASGAAEVGMSLVDEAVCLSAADVSVTTHHPLPDEDFPAFGPLSDPLFQASFGRDVVGVLRRISPAISAEETRYYLNGVFMHSGDLPGEINLCATDGHRLHMASVICPDAVGRIPDGGIILPHRALSLLLRISDQDKREPIVFRVAKEMKRNAAGDLAEPGNTTPRVVVTIGTTTIRSKLIDGTFPDYKRVIPKDTPVHITFAAQDLIRAVSCVIVGTSQSSNPCVKLSFSPGTAALECQWNHRESTAEVTVPCAHSLPDGAVFGLNGRYLLAAITALGAESTVTMALTEAPTDRHSSPICLHTPDDAAFKAIVMPMRV